MISLLHGNNIKESRDKLVEFILLANTSKKEVINLNGLKLDFDLLNLNLRSDSLIAFNKLIIIENLFSRPKSNVKDKIINYLKKTKVEDNIDLIFWEGKEIAGTTLRWLPKTWQMQIFKTPVIIFKFLDSIKPNNQKQILPILHQALKQESAEMIFYMLARQIRLLILAKDLGKKGLTGTPWQIGRLCHQASFFTIKKLLKLYQSLLKIDLAVKTGQSSMSLNWHLDLLIIDL